MTSMKTGRGSRLSWSSTTRGKAGKNSPATSSQFTRNTSAGSTTTINNNKPTLETYQQMEAYMYGLSTGEKIDPMKAVELAAQYPYDPVMTAWQADWHLRHAGQIKTADELWQRSVQQGLYAAASSTTRPHPYAKYHAGMLFQLGKAGLTQNFRVAVVWYKKAAAEGVASAHFQLGWLHETNGAVGQSLDKSSHHNDVLRAQPNIDQARYHYEQAAAVGHAAAQYNLAELLMKHYATTTTTASDDENADDDETTPMAHMLYVQAALQGYTLAKTRLKQLFAPASASQGNQGERRIEEEHEELRVLLQVDQEEDTRRSKKKSAVTESAVSNLIADLLGESDRWSSAVWEDEVVAPPSDDEIDHQSNDDDVHTPNETTDTPASDMMTTIDEDTTKENISAVETVEEGATVMEAETDKSRSETEISAPEASFETAAVNEETATKEGDEPDLETIEPAVIVTDKEPPAEDEGPDLETTEAKVVVTEEGRAAEDEGPGLETTIDEQPTTEEEGPGVLTEEKPTSEEEELPAEIKSAAVAGAVRETPVAEEKPTPTPSVEELETEGEDEVDLGEAHSEASVEEEAEEEVVNMAAVTTTEPVSTSLQPLSQSPKPPTASIDSAAPESPTMVTKSTTKATSTEPPSPEEMTKATLAATAAAASLPPARQLSTSKKLKELLDQSRQLRTAVSDRHNEVSLSSLNYNDDEVDQLVQESRRFRAEAAKRERRAVELEKDTHNASTKVSVDEVVKQNDPPQHEEPSGSSFTDFGEDEGKAGETQIPIHEIKFTTNTVDEENQPLTSPEEWYDAICALLDGLNKVQINPTLALRQVNRARAKLVDENEDPILTAFSAECHEHLRQGARTDSLMLQAVQQGLLQQAKQNAAQTQQSSPPTSNASIKYAQYFVGTLCEHGRGGALPSAEKAAVWYKQAASQGLARAYYAWGNLYFHGQLGDEKKRDFKRARILYHKAAAQGHALAQTSLAEMYERGFGVAIDLKKAFDYEERSALQGPAQAQVLRGALCENGQIPGGIDLAKEWYLRAAGQEHAGASYHLGMLYQKGLLGANPESGEPDLGKAIEYFQTAANQGHAKAKAALESLQTRQWIGGLFDWGQVVNSFTGKTSE